MSIKINPTDIIDNRFVGVPYKLNGKNFDGSDCMNLILLWYKENGITFDYDQRDANDFKKSWLKSPGSFTEMVLKYGRVVVFHELKKFDFILFFSSEDTIFPNWPAVMVDDRHFLINCDKTKSSVHILDMEWKNKFWGGIRPRQVGG